MDLGINDTVGYLYVTKTPALIERQKSLIWEPCCFLLLKKIWLLIAAKIWLLFTGVLREPINACVEGGTKGILVGVYMGSTGLILKPVSGLLEFLSRSIGGLGEAIRAFGEEVTRVPKTRIRSPQQFLATGLPTGKHTIPDVYHNCLILNISLKQRAFIRKLFIAVSLPVPAYWCCLCTAFAATCSWHRLYSKTGSNHQDHR